MRTILPAVVGAILALPAIEASSQAAPAERPIAFTIEGPTLADALDKWAEQAGFQLVLSNWDVAKRLVPPSLKGTFSAQAALEKLLADTPLTYVWLSGRAVAIRERPKSVVDSRTTTGDVKRPRWRLARLKPAGKRPGDAAPSQQAFQDPDLKATTLDELIVTGSRLRRAGEGPEPVSVFSRREIDRLGAATVSDVLKYLPQQSYTRQDGFTSAGGQFAELRGLGLDTTLILINGRRVVMSAAQSTSNAFDLNAIPLAAVDRVEILSDSASAIYGADAVGGVINVVLREGVREPVLDLRLGSADGGAEERRGSLSLGFAGERIRATAMLDYLGRDFLLGRERDRFSNQDFTGFGGTDNRSASANPGNISSRTPGNLPGLSSPTAAVPPGSSGVGLTPASFAATAGQQNRESLGRFRSIIPKADRYSAAAFLEFDLAANATAFGEMLYADLRTETQSWPSTLAGDRVPEANAFNPFGVDVSVSYLFEGVGPVKFITDSDLLRAVGGVRGGLGSWSWEVSAVWTDEDATTRTRNRVDPALAGAALASSDPAQALNVFQDGPGGSPALLASLVAAVRPNEFSIQGLQPSAFLRGPLVALPAGDLEMAAGGEWREEEASVDLPSLVIDGDRNVSAGFVELSVPLIGADMAVPAVDRLLVTLAGRYDDYSDFGDTANAQYGIVWAPSQDLLLRASYGTSFRPPSLFELYAPRLSFAGLPVNDPRRNNERVNVVQTFGGNTELQSIEGDSLTAGFVLTPTWLRNFRSSASYWRVRLEDRVTSLAAGVLLANENLFPGRVVRGQPTDLDLALGLPGQIVSVDSSRINAGELATSGIDLAVSYHFDTGVGRFSPALAATWVDTYEAADIPGAPVAERAGFFDDNLGTTIPKWRAVAMMGWDFRGLALSGAARYTPRYDARLSPAATSATPVESQTIVDVQGALDLGEAFDRSPWLKGMRVAVGIINVFDEEPPFVLPSLLGLDISQADLRQRFAYVTLSRIF